MASSLKKKAVKGISWNLIEKFSITGIKFVLGIILARLLTPRDFGLIGMVTVFFTIAQVFIDSGFGSAYIQKKEVTDVDANTVFFTNLGISVILFGVLWFAAPLIARFYEETKLINLTRVMSFVVLINAFNVIQNAQVTRNVDFKRKTKITLFATIISGLSGITAAYYGLGVWSLVVQQLTNRLIVTVGLSITNKWNPSLKFSSDSFKEMFSFGSWVLFTGIIRSFFDNIYILTIGKFFPAAELGFYTKAKHMEELASSQLSSSVGVVAFPVFSQLQNEKQRLQNAVRKFLTHTFVFTVPILIGLIVLAKPFVLLLLTEKWSPMIPYLRLLSIVGLLYPFHAVNVQVLQGQGKSNLNFKISLIKNSLRIINLFVMYRFGVLYIIIGQVILSFIALLINTFYTHVLIDYGFLKQVKDIYKIVGGSIAAGLISYIIMIQFTNLFIMFLIGGLVLIALYILSQFLFNKKIFFEIISLKELF